MRLLPDVRDHVYMCYFGRGDETEVQGAWVVRGYPDGGYPRKPSDLEIEAALARAAALLQRL